MTKTYWIREGGRGAYCEGDIPDGAYDPMTCILVTKKPSPAHYWDYANERWAITLDKQKTYIRNPRDTELRRTDKFMITDYNATFTAQERAEMVTYRQALRDLTSKTSIEEMVMPPCPEFLKD